MIQRIQSIFLVVISIVSAVFYFYLPSFDFSGLGLTTFPLFKSYLILSGGLSLLTMLLFKRRKLQLSMNRFHCFLQAFVSAFLLFEMVSSGDFNSYLLILIMPLLALILLILSSRAIRKDEDLVRSIDRLR